MHVPEIQVEHIFALQQRFNYERFGFESNGFQEAIGSMIKEHQEKLRRAGAPWRLPLEPHNNSHSKHARISLLEPRILSGQIQFNQDLPQQFYMQADEYNGSTRGHDDALDALASCTEMIQRHSAPRRQIKTIPRPAGWRH